jgi:hypothetical protein
MSSRLKSATSEIFRGDAVVINLMQRVLVLLTVSALCLPAAQASPILFTPNGDNNAGSLKCEVPVRLLGDLPLKDGTATISGRVISVKAGSAYIEIPRTVLVGSVLRTEANFTSSPPSITGIALFLMGDWQSQIDDGTVKDMIFCKEGHQEGRILGIENDSLSVNVNGRPGHIPLSSVLYIRSPRVFVFKIALSDKQPVQKDAVVQAEATETSFRPTATARTLSGSVIPANERREDGMESIAGPGGSAATPISRFSGPPGLGAENTLNGLNSMQPTNNVMRPGASGPNPMNDSIDNGEEAARFSTIHTKWGDQRLNLPPGILD